MQPDKKHRRTIKGKKERARLFLKAHLGWLKGWPAEAEDGSLRWMRLIIDQNNEYVIKETPIGPVLLRQAETTLSKLVNEHPEQIPSISGGAADWPERTKAMLEALKRAWAGKITASAALAEIVSAWPRREQALMRKMAKEQPADFWIAELLAWRNNLTAKRMSVLAPWLVDNLKAMGRMVRQAGTDKGIKHAILLAVLVEKMGPESAAYWLDILSHAKSWGTPLLDAKSECRAVNYHLENAKICWKGRRRWPGWEPNCHTMVATYLEGLLWNSPNRKKDFDGFTLLTSALFNREAIGKMHETSKALWTNLGEALKWLRDKVRKCLWPPEAEELEKCLQSAHELSESLPDISFCDAANRLGEMCDQDYFDDWQKLSDFLRSLPVELNGTHPRHQAWNFMAKIIALRNGKLYEAAFRFLEGTAVTEITGFITAIHLDRWHLDNWLEKMAETRMVSPGKRIGAEERWRWFEAVRLVAARAPEVLSSSEACINIGYLSFHIPDMDALVDAGVSLMRHAWFRESQPIVLFQMAFRFEPLGADPIAMLAAIAGYYEANRNIENPDEFDSQLNKLVDCLRSSDRISDISPLINGKPDIARLRSLALKSSAFLALMGPQSVIQRQVFPEFDWPKRYPGKFLPLLERIGALSENARTVVGNILDKDFPDRDLIADEVAKLSARIGTSQEAPGMSKRLANLEAVLAKSPKTPSAKRLENLEEKLKACIGRMAPLALETDLSGAVLESVHIRGRERFTRFGDTAIDILMAILSLRDRAQRELGIAVWKQGLRQGPWELMTDHPVNANFVEKMTGKGISLEPWMNPAAPRDMPTANGKTYSVGISMDPLDILLMGEHFKSCLSLHGGNFFSTITNAVDINKRVLYAREPGGTVAGRCLLALTDEGTILTFHAYCHDAKAEFDRMADAFARDLAERMGTTTALKGKVSTLVASRWYNDGPEDLSHRFDFTLEGSAFRAQVPAVPAADFPELLQGAIHPLGIDHEVLTRTFNISEVQERPELVEQLARMLEACRNVPLETWTCFAGKAIAMGLRGTAQAIIDKYFPRDAQGLLRWFKPIDYDSDALAILDLIGESKPSLALRLLRATRHRKMTEDKYEHYQPRRKILAAVHRRLGRHALADQLAQGD